MNPAFPNTRSIRQQLITAFAALAIMASPLFALAAAYTGKIVDADTGKAIEGASITTSDGLVISDAQGQFSLNSSGSWIGFRAPGYLRSAQFTNQYAPGSTIKLRPFEPKGLYLSLYGIGSSLLRNRALELIDATELNTLVIDIKGDKGLIALKVSNPLSSEIGAQKVITIKDAKAMIESFHQRGIYTIARIVTFKDNLLANAKPQLAVRDRNGNMFRDREKLAWVDPSRKEVWDYVGSIAEEAAKVGFDEIQFDYVRFPDTKGVQFSIANNQENRVNSITGFLGEMRKRLTPYNVYISADIFGYVLWNTDDTQIGQSLDRIAGVVDYMAPMLYPSGFQFGLPGVRNPIADPYNIVYMSLMKGQERTKLSGIRFRPWLQAFRDYAFPGRRHFKEKEISDQIRASAKSGSHGYMLWNPRNAYSLAGLPRDSSARAQREKPPAAPNNRQALENEPQSSGGKAGASGIIKRS